ncbi:MAG: hypothetical protein VXY16_08425, partial [Pseudomonadota bacterium]|nr:hypothetical protein [Pseudomonadota bacterium]
MFAERLSKVAACTLLGLGVSLLSGCGYNPLEVDVKPRGEPVYNYTQSSNLLDCVGKNINYSNVPSIDVYVSNIPDHTIPSIESGFLTKNSVMMVTTALDRFNTNKVAVVGKNGGDPRRRQIQILGSFTELNRTTSSSAMSSESLFPGGFELEFGADKNFNHIALDLAMSEENRIVPGTSTSVAVQVHGNSGDVTLTYDDGDEFAAIGAAGFTAQEGFHAAQRLLIETSVALMMSKYFDIPIRNCLNAVKKPETQKIYNPYDRPVFGGSDEIPALTIDNGYYSAPAMQQSGALTVYDNNGQPQQYNGKRLDLYRYDQSLPEANGHVFIPGNGGRRYLYDQPRSYDKEPADGYAGVDFQ